MISPRISFPNTGLTASQLFIVANRDARKPRFRW
jgi:hypothetical protein